MHIQCFTHPQYTSNTYLLTQPNFSECYLIDIGSSQKVLNALHPNQRIKGIFLTHAHYDHIYGINDIMGKFPDCIIYCSPFAKESLYSEKLNLSFYHENPLILQKGTVFEVSEENNFPLFPEFQIKILETPGHNKGSISFLIKNGLFTGDSLIPQVPVVTKLKSGNKEEAVNSLEKIKNLMSPEQFIYPGHGEICKVSDLHWEFYFKNIISKK